MPTADLLDLAEARLATLAAEADDSPLDAVIRRLFDPAERDTPVCAFSSSL